MNSNAGEPTIEAHRMRAPRLALIAVVAFLCVPAAPAVANHSGDDTADGKSSPLAPDPNTPPDITGTEQDGSVLQGDEGDWDMGVNVDSFWLRCDQNGINCEDVGSGPSYDLGPTDVGKRIKLRVTGSVLLETNEIDVVTGVIAPGPPFQSSPPVIVGTPQAGSALTATPGSNPTGTPTLTSEYRWLRCNDTSLGSCVSVAGPTGSPAAYMLAEPDVGKRMRIRRTITGPGGTFDSNSAHTAIVQPRDFPGTPFQPPSAGGGTGSLPTPGGTLDGLSPLRPFPIIAIGGRVLRSGVVLTVLRIRRAPRGSRVTVVCRGRGCPFKRRRYRMRRSTFRIRRLERRRLRRGMVITIYVKKGNAIGKYTRFRIRRGAAPARIDRCVRPRSSRPTRCP